MTNLPITASTPQTSAPGKKPSGSAETADAQNSQPFGAVLARQIGTPALKGAKADDRLAVELAAQTVAEATDVRKEDKTAAEAAFDLRAAPPTDLPSEMLAALMPQALNTAVTTSAPAGTRTDGPASAPADVSGIPPRKPDLAAGIQTAATAQTAPPAVAEPQGGERAAFAAALVQAGTAASQETGAVLREAGIAAAATSAAAVSAAAQQANTAVPAAVQSAVASIVAPALQTSQLTVSTPVNQARWGDEFSQKITWLASGKVDQSAELHLNPPQLGPLDVVLKVSGDQATALFTSPHAAVRDAIEQALPRLRDMLADNGITLGNTTVSDQAPREQGKPDAQRSPGSADNDQRDTAATGGTATRVSPISRHNGIVDTFA
ncbi:MAG: flagellar hook-length control protein FliK [Nitrosomonadales bacterium]|nr:flagellar hook-length control protein FliK [Nitrosomonadales bacterium]